MGPHTPCARFAPFPRKESRKVLIQSLFDRPLRFELGQPPSEAGLKQGSPVLGRAMVLPTGVPLMCLSVPSRRFAWGSLVPRDPFISPSGGFPNLVPRCGGGVTEGGWRFYPPLPPFFRDIARIPDTPERDETPPPEGYPDTRNRDVGTRKTGSAFF
jgi:hypothetical protein